MNDLVTGAARRIGWLLFALGVLTVVSYAAYEFVSDDAVSAILKTAFAAVVVGLILLFVSVLRQRLIDRRTDKYEDVEI